MKTTHLEYPYTCGEDSLKLKADNMVISDAINLLHQACMEQGEENFLKSAMYHFHRLLNADFVIAGMINKDNPSSIETSIVLHEGVIVPNITYELEGTPCSNVVDINCCIYPSKVAELFPSDKFFTEFGIEGYVGTPLMDNMGNCTGLIVALTKREIDSPELYGLITKLFAVAIAPILKRKSN